MNRLGTVLKAAGVLIAAVLAGFLASWLHGRSLSSNDHISLSEPANTGSANSSAIGSNQGRHPTPESSTTAGLSIGSSAVPSSLITNWEDKVEEILTSGQPDADKTARMLDLFPHLPEDGQVEVAQHLSNLLPDENYAAVGQYLTNSATPEGVLDVLMGGLLNRP